MIPGRNAIQDPDPCKHGYVTYTDAAGRVHVATGGRCSDVPIPADPDRDARVAKRRAEDARKAGAALDQLLTPGRMKWWDERYLGGFTDGFHAGYAASALQHNRHYVPSNVCTLHGTDCRAQQNGRDCAGLQHNAHYARPDEEPLPEGYCANESCYGPAHHAAMGRAGADLIEAARPAGTLWGPPGVCVCANPAQLCREHDPE